MTCKEFQQVLPEIMEGGRSVEQDSHLRSCSACTSIVSDLQAISQSARSLRGFEEPSPRVWNAIEMALREEGLVRQPQPLELVARPRRRWNFTLLAPVAAGLIIAAFFVSRYTRPGAQVADNQPVNIASTARLQAIAPHIGEKDQRVLESMAGLTPAMRATYEASMQDVNSYIQDAEETAQQNPNDEDARQALMEAYQQKNMVYEMAMDRSLR